MMDIKNKKKIEIKNKKSKLHFALVGNPNVGKSVIFNYLTGMGVQTANYSGTTVRINKGKTDFRNKIIDITDLPGVYGLSGISEDQWVARQAILEQKPDCLIAITDTTNLQRNLYLVLQLIDLGLPIILGLNLIDLAESKKIITDVKMLELMLGIPVVPTIAIQGKGLDLLMQKATEQVGIKVERKYRYGSDFEKQVNELTSAIKKSERIPFGLEPEAFSFLLMEDDKEFIIAVKTMENGSKVLAVLSRVKESIRKSHGQSLNQRLALERYGLAGSIVSDSQKQDETKGKISDKLWRLSTHPFTGLITLLIFITVFFAIVVSGGIFLSSLFATVWTAVVSPSIKAVVHFIIGSNSVSKIILWGIDDGTSAALSIGVAFVLPFYLLLALLEDSGYLNSIAFLSDRLAHRIGLHGRSLIPLISGAGCNVPAIIGTRALGNNRERFIASTLICIVPCSARTAVILGSVALFAGIDKALLIYLVSLIVIFGVGFALNKIMPGQSTGLVMEMFPFRVPTIKNTFIKTWTHLKGFISQAMLLIIGGSLIMGLLFETGYLDIVSKPVSFISVTMLGLPAITGVVLLVGFLRKEMALELLYVLAAAKFGSGFKLPDLMSSQQMFIFALVIALYIPCMATFSILTRELDLKKAIYIAILTTVVAILIGSAFNFGFKLF